MDELVEELNQLRISRQHAAAEYNRTVLFSNAREQELLATIQQVQDAERARRQQRAQQNA